MSQSPGKSRFFNFIAFIPFIACLFFYYWNVKVVLVLNSVIIITFIAFILFNIKNKIPFALPGYYNLLFFSVFFSILSFSISPVRSLISVEYVSFISGFLLFILAINNDDVFENKKIFYYYPFILAVAVFSFYNLSKGGDVISVFKNSNTLAFFIILILGILLSNKKYYIAVLFFVMLLFTKSIAAMLSVCVVSVYYAVRNYKNIEFKKNISVIIFLILLTGFLVYSIDIRSVENRLDWWNVALKMFSERPLTGWGYASYTYILPAFLSGGLKSIYTHNYFLETLAEHGVFFIIFWFAFLIFSIKNIKGFYHYMFIAALIHNFFDFGLNVIPCWWLFMYLLGYSLKESSVYVKLNSRIIALSVYFISLVLFIRWGYLVYEYIEVSKIYESSDNSDYREELAKINRLTEKYPYNFDLILYKSYLMNRKFYETKDVVDLIDYARSIEYALILNPYYVKGYKELERVYSKMNNPYLLNDLHTRKSKYMYSESN